MMLEHIESYQAGSRHQAIEVSEVVEEYAPLVKKIALHLMARLPHTVQLSDLIQSGLIGLLEAARQYDPSHGASFSTYAGIRIRGAMIDELRRGDWAPRSVHRNQRLIKKSIEHLETVLGREPSDTEVALDLNMTMTEYNALLQDSLCCQVLSVEEDGINGLGEIVDEGDSVEKSLCGGGMAGPHIEAEREQFLQHLSHQIAMLPERQRLILSLYYDEEMNMKEIGLILDLSESRICQIYARTTLALQKKMQAWRL